MPTSFKPTSFKAARLAHWSAIALAAAAVGAYYLWELRSAGYRFEWRQDQSGYYNYLGRAFAHGRLALPIQPSPQLLAAPNPWDPALDDAYKMHDMAFFHGRYYLYHGPGPAALLFTPWLLITGHDLPERFALFLLCFGGFVFSCGTLLRWLALAGAKLGPPLLALMLLALGLCQCIPYLLSRVWVYEVAIAGGYFCISGAMFFLARGVESDRSTWWLAASGLMFGLAISCRPHLGLAGVIALAGLAIFLKKPRAVIAFAAAFILIGLLVAAYNYQRFGDPFEFGLRYLLAGVNQNRIRLAPANLLPGLYFWLACPPDFGLVFPWVRLAFRHPFNSPGYPFPPQYFMEATAGVLFLAPFVVGAWVVPSCRRALKILPWTALITPAAVLLFLAATGFTTQRYEVDFLPTLVLVALANLGVFIGRSQGLGRTVLCAALAVTVACGAIVNMALGIAGPYDEMLKNRPRNYLRLAHWFSPVERYRPVLNPPVHVAFTAEFTSTEDRLREPLLTMGRQAWRYFLYAEHTGGALRLISESGNSRMVYEMGGQRKAAIEAKYLPESGKMSITVDGREAIVHEIGTLVTAPSEIAIGENRIDSGMTVARFTGRVQAR